MNRDECILYNGPRMPDGYGYAWCRKLQSGTTAHRAAWIDANDIIPATTEVCHKCESLYPKGDITYRRCINLDHLYLGTHDDNMHDLTQSGRRKGVGIGVDHGLAKLNEPLVLIIRARWANGEPVAKLAAEYGVGRSTIYAVVQRLTWTHI